MRALPQRQTDGGLGGMGGIGVAGGENAPSAPPPPAYEAFEQPATPYGQQRQRRVISVYGDGHCMFRSIASAVMPSLQNLPRNSFGIIIDRNNRDKEKEAALELRHGCYDGGFVVAEVNAWVNMWVRDAAGTAQGGGWSPYGCAADGSHALMGGGVIQTPLSLLY